MYRKIFEVPTYTLTEEDLRSLIDREVSEGPYLDYKVEEDFKRKRKEVAKDVAACANAYGGYLIYGVKEEGGLPKELVGMNITNPDEAVSSIERSLRDLTEPPIEVHIQPVRLESGRYVIVVEVPRSLNAPHMADGRFYRRSGRSSARMNYVDVRRAFAEKGNVIRKMRERLRQRIADLESGYGPVRWSPWAGAFLYVASIPAFDAGLQRIFGPQDRERVPRLSLFYDARPTNFCADGLLASLGNGEPFVDFALLTPEGELLHGTGPLDKTDLCAPGGEESPRLSAHEVQTMVIELMSKGLSRLGLLGFDPPYYAALVLVRARDYLLIAEGSPEHMEVNTERPIRHPFLLFDQLLLEEDARIVSRPLPQYDRANQERVWRERAARLQPILDRLYQAAGAEYSRIAHALDDAGSS